MSSSFLSRPVQERGAHYLREIPTLDAIEDAAKALCILVSMYVSEPDPPLDPRYETTPESLALLRREPGLHALLKRAHAEGGYDLVRNSVLIRKLAPFPQRATEFLDTIRPLLAEFINSPTPIPRWTSDSDSELDPASRAHVESLDLMHDMNIGGPQ
ncbi:hypothetical protein B0H12DRAFT_330686 [Mycena haematopus]|nr:hypothetical protein B0H12DRAFT_330686 [Mycena haematopus]